MPSTVLIIEDSLDQLDMYELVLRDAGYRMQRATHGIVGFDLAVADPPDVILIDLNLPDIDGWSVCDMLQENAATASVPVIILTARDDYDMPLRAARANVALLRKPCSVDRLKTAISAAVGAPRRGGQTRRD